MNFKVIAGIALGALGAGAGCGAAQNVGSSPAASVNACPARTLALDAEACAALPARGASAETPLEWGSTEGLALWAGRLRCQNGAVPFRRKVGEGGRAPASQSPPSQTATEPELLELWEVSCPNQQPMRLYLNPHRCGSPCPPPGLAVTGLHVEAALQAAHAALQQDRTQDAFAWAKLAAHQAVPDQVVQSTLGHAALLAHAWPDAAAAFEAVLAMDTADPTARMGLALSRVQNLPADKGLRVESVPSAPVSALPDQRHLRVRASDAALLDELGALTGTPAIEPGDLDSAQGSAIVARLDCVRAGGDWLRPTLGQPLSGSATLGWEMLRDVVTSGETRLQTWVRIEQSQGALNDVQRCRGPQGFARALLADPAAAWRGVEADLPVHEAALPEAWALERVRSEVTVPLLLAATMALVGAEMQNPELTADQAVVLVDEPWQAAWYETVSLARILRVARLDADPEKRRLAAQFLGQVLVAADTAVQALATASGPLDGAVARSPALFRAAQVVRETDAWLRRALGMPEPPRLPTPAPDARPDPNAFRRSLVPLKDAQPKLRPPSRPKK